MTHNIMCFKSSQFLAILFLSEVGRQVPWSSASRHSLRRKLPAFVSFVVNARSISIMFPEFLHKTPISTINFRQPNIIGRLRQFYSESAWHFIPPIRIILNQPAMIPRISFTFLPGEVYLSYSKRWEKNGFPLWNGAILFC